MFVRTKKRGERTYLMIVENERVEGRVRQKVVLNLGRLDVLQASGTLDGLFHSLGRFASDLDVMGAHARGESVSVRTRHVGPDLVFGRLWRDLGIGRVLEKLLAGRKFEFAVERAVYLTVLHRLFASGSDRAAEKWREQVAIPGAENLSLHHLYRAMAWLGSPLEASAQAGATPFAPRCVKDLVEEALFERRRDLFSTLDIVFFDTTSIYFEGAGGETLGQNGHSKDHRPDLKQMVVGMILDGQGRPLCSEMWPGNTADVKSLVPVVERLRRQFALGRVCIVADRGMISRETMRQIEERQWQYILGVRMRSSNEARYEVLSRAGRYEEVHAKSRNRKAPSALKVKEVWVGANGEQAGEESGRRYVVCLNEDQAAKDRHDREAIVAALQDALKHGDKSLIGNKGYRRYVLAQGPRFAIDTKKIQDEARFDGKWVLTTNTDMPARELALKYKELWMVEDVFRTMKSALETRPIWHKCDETIRGHVFCSFLAIVLRKELEDRLAARDWSLEWADIVRDLSDLHETEITVQGKGYIVRSETKGAVGKVTQAAGAALPPVLRPCQAAR